MLYTLWDAITGIIVGSGRAKRPELQLRPGIKIILGEALDDSLWRINPETEQKESIIPSVDIARELRLIDRQAEEIRGLFITNTPSQPAVYMAKEAEALSVVGTDEIATPNIDLEAARTGESRFDVAVVILTQANQWRQISAVIEDRRLAAKEQVRATGLPVIVDWSDIAAMAVF